MAQVTAYKVDTLVGVKPEAIVALKVPNENKFELYITNKLGVPYPLSTTGTSGGINNIVNTDGELNISGSSTITINVSNALLTTINSALQAGDNISNLVNNVGYITSVMLPTNTSDLVNDGADGTSTYVEADELGAAAFSNSYNDLNNLPPPTDITGKVPYIGAIQSVDLGEYQLKTGQLEFDQTPTQIAGVAKLRWNDSDGTLDLGMKGGNVTLQIGQEQLLRVVNKTGVDLLEAQYRCVYISGSQGNRLKVDLALSNNTVNSNKTIGLVTENINNNNEGFVTTSGLIRGINTTGNLQSETWIEGDVLYLSAITSGALTNVLPISPNHKVLVGYVVNSHITQGSIFVKVDTGLALNELHNVNLIGTTVGKIIGSTTEGLWENKTISDILGYTSENILNKQNSLTIDGTGTKYPTVDAVNLGITNSNHWTKTGSNIANNNTGDVNIISNLTLSSDKYISLTSTSSSNSININNYSTGSGINCVTYNDGIGVKVVNLSGSTGNPLTLWHQVLGDLFTVNASGNTNTLGSSTANSFIKSGGTSSQFLKANGSIDNNTYATLTSPLFTTPRLSATSTTGYVWTATDALGNGSFQAVSGNITGSGTTNFIPKFTSSGIIGNSLVKSMSTWVELPSETYAGTVRIGNGAGNISTNFAYGNSALGGVTGGSSTGGIGTNAGTYTSTGALNTTPVSCLFLGNGTRSFTNNDIGALVIGTDAIGIGNYCTVIGGVGTNTTAIWGGVILASGASNALITADITGKALITKEYLTTQTANNVLTSGNQSITGIKSFSNIGTSTNVEVTNSNTQDGSSALLVNNINSGKGIRVENTNVGVGIYSNGTSTGLNYVGANGGVNTFTVNKTGTVEGASFIATSGTIRLKNYTIATLPTGVQGDTAYVTDALAPTYLGTLVAGGAVVCPVFNNGTNWVSN